MNNVVVPPRYQQPNNYAVPSGYNFVPNGYVHDTSVSVSGSEDNNFMPIGYDGTNVNKFLIPRTTTTSSGYTAPDVTTAWGSEAGIKSDNSYANADFGYDKDLLSEMGQLSIVFDDENNWDSYYEKIKRKIDGFPGGVYGMQAVFVTFVLLVKKSLDYLRAYRLKKFNDKLDDFMVSFSQISMDSATSTDRDAQVERLDNLRKQVDDYYPGEDEKKEIKTNLLSLIVSMKTFLRSRDDLVGGRRGTKRRRRGTGKRIRKTHKRRRQKRTHRRRKH